MGKLWGDAQCPSLCRGHLEGPGLAPCGAEDICPGLPRQGVALSPVTTSEREALGSLSSAGGGTHPCSAWALCCPFQIHSYTHGCHSDHRLGHLSVTETELLRDPEAGRQVRAGPGVGGTWRGGTRDLSCVYHAHHLAGVWDGHVRPVPVS